MAKNTLTQAGIETLYHITPLHYLGLIAKDHRLLSKEQLRERDIPSNHFRQSTKAEDIAMGFEDVVHLRTDAYPPVLHEALRCGFPHVRLEVPAEPLAEEQFLICRYHIAAEQDRLRESDADGYIHQPYKIPVASSVFEKRGMLKIYAKEPFEILIPTQLPLDNIQISVFSLADQNAAVSALKRLSVSWPVRLEEHSTVRYTVGSHRRKEVVGFLNQSLLPTQLTRERPEFD